MERIPEQDETGYRQIAIGCRHLGGNPSAHRLAANEQKPAGRFDAPRTVSITAR